MGEGMLLSKPPAPLCCAKAAYLQCKPCVSHALYAQHCPSPLAVPAQALDMGPLWDEKIANRMGRWFWGKESRPADKRRIYLEYPSGAHAVHAVLRLLQAVCMLCAVLVLAAAGHWRYPCTRIADSDIAAQLSSAIAWPVQSGFSDVDVCSTSITSSTSISRTCPSTPAPSLPPLLQRAWLGRWRSQRRGPLS